MKSKKPICSTCKNVKPPVGKKCKVCGNSTPYPGHHCHARGCAIKVPPEMLMCKKHWYMVPKKIQLEVWKNYRAGQCDDMKPSKDWHRAADAAIKIVYKKELLLINSDGKTLQLRKIK